MEKRNVSLFQTNRFQSAYRVKRTNVNLPYCHARRIAAKRGGAMRIHFY